jgi:hypothetical protein
MKIYTYGRYPRNLATEVRKGTAGREIAAQFLYSLHDLGIFEHTRGWCS